MKNINIYIGIYLIFIFKVGETIHASTSLFRIIATIAFFLLVTFVIHTSGNFFSEAWKRIKFRKDLKIHNDND